MPVDVQEMQASNVESGLMASIKVERLAISTQSVNLSVDEASMSEHKNTGEDVASIARKGIRQYMRVMCSWCYSV